MIATLILLNTRITFHTLFSMCENPISRFTFIRTFFGPFDKIRTLHRLMCLFSAFEAERNTAIASDGGDPSGSDSYLFASRGWTPLKIFGQLNKISSHEYTKFLFLYRRTDGVDNTTRNYQTAFEHGTIGSDTTGALSNFSTQV